VKKKKMNKTKRIAFGIGIVLTVLTVFTASAAAGNLLYFAPQDSSAESGNETTVKLMLNTTHTDIRSFQCHIDLDTDVVNVTSGSRGSYYWHAWNWLVRDDPVYGPYLFVYAIQYSPTGPEPPEVELGVFTFEGVNPGVSPLDFIRRQQPGEPEPHPDPTLLTDTNNDLLPFDWTNGNQRLHHSSSRHGQHHEHEQRQGMGSYNIRQLLQPHAERRRGRECN
jgi:hypothetical protein